MAYLNGVFAGIQHGVNSTISSLTNVGTICCNSIATTGKTCSKNIVQLFQNCGSVLSSCARSVASKTSYVWQQLTPHLSSIANTIQSNGGMSFLLFGGAVGCFAISHNSNSTPARFVFAGLGIASIALSTAFFLQTGTVRPVTLL